MKYTLLLTSLLLVCHVSSAQRLRFAHVTDTHVGSLTGAEDLSKTVEDINRQADIDFVLLTGDITEFGTDDELRQSRKIIDRLQKP